MFQILPLISNCFFFLFFFGCFVEKQKQTGNLVDGLSSTEPLTSWTNPVLEPVQPKQPAPLVVPPSVTADEESTAPASDHSGIDQLKQRESTKPAEEEIKPNPFGFELPVLRSVSASQLPPPIVAKEPELVLPTLRPVSATQLPPPIVAKESELVLPTLRPVPEKAFESLESVAAEPTPVQWELPPLDSRPNLQALLEREKKAAEAAVNNQAFKQHQEEQQRKQQQEEQQRRQQQEEQQRKQQELFRKQQQEELQRKQEEQQKQQQLHQIQTQKRQIHHQQQQIVMTEEMRMAQEAQLAKLSVRLKVQRFESAPINYIGQVSVSQSGSPRMSGFSSPTQPILTGRCKPTTASTLPLTPTKQVDSIRFVSNTKENAVPAPLPAPSPIIPRMMEPIRQPEPLPMPKVTKVIVNPQPPPAIQHQRHLPPLEPLPTVQLRQPAISMLRNGCRLKKGNQFNLVCFNRQDFDHQ